MTHIEAEIRLTYGFWEEKLSSMKFQTEHFKRWVIPRSGSECFSKTLEYHISSMKKYSLLLFSQLFQNQFPLLTTCPDLKNSISHMNFPFNDSVNRMTSAKCRSSFPKHIWQGNLPSLVVILSIFLFASLADPTERASYQSQQ